LIKRKELTEKKNKVRIYLVSIIKSLTEIFTEGESVNGGSYRLFINGGRTYIEGVTGINAVSDKEISVFHKKGVLIISGESLIIEKLYISDMLIKGRIKNVSNEIN